MSVATESPVVGWVKPAESISGLDHLGSAAPCVTIYSTLLPGITNVTDRARYYSFYPWFLWKYTQMGEPIESARFHELFRRADCLFTLIAEHHSTTTGEATDAHGSRMVGREVLVPALRELATGRVLRLTDYATEDNQGLRYFKNRLGGLGQYYLGTLEDLGILVGRSGDFVQYDKKLGAEIAGRFDAGVPGKEFWETISKGTVTTKVLTQLAPFCPCQLKQNRGEHAWLKELFLGNLQEDETSRLRRRQSLGLILDLTHQLAKDPDAVIEPSVFRQACYSGSLPDGTPWQPPAELLSIRDEWRLYQRNELLSVGCQALLTVFVRALELMPSAPANAATVARFVLAEPTLGRIAKRSWTQHVEASAKVLPSQAEHGREHHEISVVQQLFQLNIYEGTAKELAKAVGLVLQIFAALSIRADGAEGAPYGELPITASTLAEYPINLIAFEKAQALWRSRSVAGVVEWLMSEWVCETHLRNALRKLRYQRRDTFRFYPTDNGLKAREVPGYGYSNPRIRQAIQVLRDLSALASDADGRLQITAIGRKYLEDACRN